VKGLIEYFVGVLEEGRKVKRTIKRKDSKRNNP